MRHLLSTLLVTGPLACNLGEAPDRSGAPPVAPTPAASPAPPARGLPDGSGGDAQVHFDGPSATATEGDLALTITTSAASYAPGAPVHVQLVLENTGSEAAQVPFTSGQRFDVQLLDGAGTPVATWSADKSFMQMMSTLDLEPGGAETWTAKVLAPRTEGSLTLRGTIPGQPHQADLAVTVGG